MYFFFFFFFKDYRLGALDFISFVLGHEGEGSLAFCLKKKQWATRVTVGGFESGILYIFLFLSCDSDT